MSETKFRLLQGPISDYDRKVINEELERKNNEIAEILKANDELNAECMRLGIVESDLTRQLAEKDAEIADMVTKYAQVSKQYLAQIAEKDKQLELVRDMVYAGKHEGVKHAVEALRQFYDKNTKLETELAEARGKSLCLHTPIYSNEHDNYYCSKCNKGMGNAYYELAKENAAQAAEIERLREGLRKLIDARWMVSVDWTSNDEYGAIIDKAEKLLEGKDA